MSSEYDDAIVVVESYECVDDVEGREISRKDRRINEGIEKMDGVLELYENFLMNRGIYGKISSQIRRRSDMYFQFLTTKIRMIF